MDRMTVLGFIFGIAVYGLGMYEGQTLGIFLNQHAILLVVGGTIAGLMVSYSFEQAILSLKAVKIIFFPKKHPKPMEVVQTMVTLAERARREGAGAMVEETRRYNDPFLQGAVQLVADGLPSNAVEEIITAEINFIRERHKEVSNFYRVGGVYGPMFGLLGTLIGIVQVLRSIVDPASVGPAMAVAITTAFYGILLANFICLPIAQKMKLRSDRELFIKELILEGILAIQAGDLPIIVRRKLEVSLGLSERGSK